MNRQASSWRTARLAAALFAMATGAIAAALPPSRAKSDPNEVEDRLPRDTERLVDELVARGMPELVEGLLAGQPTMFQVQVARAAVRAAMETDQESIRNALLDQAIRTYRTALSLADGTEWLRGERRRFEVDEWRVELADLHLRCRAVADLDRYEVTSGLAFDRGRLKENLRQAYELYDLAYADLTAMSQASEADDELYLLLGLSDRVARLRAQCEQNRAWTGLYRVQVAEPADRDALLAQALHAFDAAARSADDPDEKYTALLGLGITLREMGRYDDADAAFDRVRDSTASIDLTIRARHEKARSLLAGGRFDEARSELEALADIPPHRTAGSATASFYVGIAPLVHAYAWMNQATPDESEDAAAPVDDAKMRGWRSRAQREFAELTDRGGFLAEAARAYLDVLSGGRREPASWTAIELRNAAREKMQSGQFASAMEPLEIVLARTDADAESQKAEARFNMAVCRFQLGQVHEAAAEFAALAAVKGGANATPESADLVRQATEYAYRCRRQIALESRSTEDCRLLAESALVLAERYPDIQVAAEAAWVAGVSLEDAGDFAAARRAYGNVARGAPNYWFARRGAVRCVQRLYEDLPPTATDQTRRQAARDAANAWMNLADDLSSSGGLAGPSDAEREETVQLARFSAATLLASDILRDYRGCLAMLVKLPKTSRVLALQIRCHRGLGELSEANAVLSDFLAQTPGAEAGAVLLGLAGEMETEVRRLRALGRRDDAARLADETVDLVRQLLGWLDTQPKYAQHRPVVRFALVKALVLAGRRDEAVDEIEKLMADDPSNGSYLRYAARLFENESEASGGGAKKTGSTQPLPADRAEQLWARLLADTSLREQSPDIYWEARYYWLRHQLRHGHANEVVRGIHTEQAWRPDLGGPPWQARLLELAEQAKSRADSGAGE